MPNGSDPPVETPPPSPVPAPPPARRPKEFPLVLGAVLVFLAAMGVAYLLFPHEKPGPRGVEGPLPEPSMMSVPTAAPPSSAPTPL